MPGYDVDGAAVITSADLSQPEPAPALDRARVARFRRVALPVLVVVLLLCLVGSFVGRALFPEKDGPDFSKIIGETYANVYLYFGEPQSEREDGVGGRVLHYDEFQVIGDHFEKREFRVFVNPNGRVYKFERD